MVRAWSKKWSFGKNTGPYMVILVAFSLVVSYGMSVNNGFVKARKDAGEFIPVISPMKGEYVVQHASEVILEVMVGDKKEEVVVDMIVLKRIEDEYLFMAITSYKSQEISLGSKRALLCVQFPGNSLIGGDMFLFDGGPAD